MIVTITEVTQEFAQNGSEYRKVKGTTPDGKETTKTVFDNLKDCWPMLEEGKTLEFFMEKKGQFWNVKNITPVAAEEVTKVKAEAKTEQDTRSKEIEKHVWLKELGECVRANIFPKETPEGKLVRAWYFTKMFEVLDIQIKNKEPLQ